MRHRIMTHTISKFQTTKNGSCVFCAFPYVYRPLIEASETPCLFLILQTVFCLDEEIGVRLCFERKQEIRYNVGPFVFSGTC